MTRQVVVRRTWLGWFSLAAFAIAFVLTGFLLISHREHSNESLSSTHGRASFDGVVATRTEDPADSPRTFRSQQAEQLSSSGATGNITLRAVHVGETPYEGTAELRDSAGTVRTFVAGAILKDGTRLAEVHADHVVLENGQRIYALSLAN